MNTITAVPFSKLHLTEKNVRTVRTSNAADAALLANIRAEGVRQNLIVEPSNEHNGDFAVIAGSRRWRAVAQLVDEGHFAADVSLPCLVKTEGSSAEASLAENLLRSAMHPADEHAAFSAMRDQGLDENEIALHFGVTVKQVRQRLKLAGVHPRILNAFRKGDLHEDAVMAFTLAETKKQQLAVFTELGSGRQCSPWAVKRVITQDGERSDSALARYVGLDAYKAAGGAVITDLFSEVDYLTDRDTLVELATAKLAAAADRLRAREGWSLVEEVIDGRVEIHKYHRLVPAPVGVPETLLAEQSNIEAQIAAMDATEDDWTDEREVAYDALTDALEAMEAKVDKYRQYSDEDKARARCFVSIGSNGKTQIARGYVTTAQQRHAVTTPEVADAPVAASLSQALLTDLGVHRQQIVKAAMVAEPALASDVLLYTLCTEVLDTRFYESQVIDAQFQAVGPAMEPGMAHAESVARLAFTQARAALVTDWLALETPAERFAALRKLSTKRKRALLAYGVSATVSVGLARPGNDTIAEAVLADLDPDYAQAWRPSDANYFSRVTRPTLLAHGATWFGEAWSADHANATKKVLVAELDAFFNGPEPEDITAELRRLRDTWLPEGFVKS